MLVVLGADVFGHLLVHAPVTPLARPGLIECVGVRDREGHFKRLVAVDLFLALDHMQLLGVRRAVGIDDGLVVLRDGIDDERVAFVVPDRLAVP